MRSAPLRDRMNSRQISPCSRMEHIAFFVRCLVAFRRAVESGGVSSFRQRLLLDGLTGIGFGGLAA